MQEQLIIESVKETIEQVGQDELERNGGYVRSPLLTDDVEISRAPFSFITSWALRDNGILTLNQLYMTNHTEVATIRKIGKVRLQECADVLESYGLDNWEHLK